MSAGRGPFEMSAEYEEHVRRQVKVELRKRMKAVRKTMPHDTRVAHAKTICETIITLPEWKKARTVAMYFAMREEIDMSVLMDAAASEKKIIALPRVDDATNTLTLHAWQEGDAMEESGFGVTEPLATARLIPQGDIDLVIVPGLAFDERGHRIGYGAGYYDRLLPLLTSAARVGVSFDFQLVAEVPNQASDVPVHFVVTNARILTAIRG